MKLLVTLVIAFLITGGMGVYSTFPKNDGQGLLIIGITWFLFFLINCKRKARKI